MRLPVLSVVLAALAATPSLSEPVRFDRSWKEQRFSLFSSNDYRFGGQTLAVASDGSVSLAYAPLPQARWGARKATWSWSVDEGVPGTDLTKKGGDDRNLALYFVFLPEQAAESLKNASVRRLLTEDQARVLVYVWGGAHKRGAVLASPYLGNRGKTVVLRGSGTGAHRESVDLAADYSRAFGGSAGALVGLAVSGDSDDTNSRIRAAISGLDLR